MAESSQSALIEWDEFRQRLRTAGWSDTEIEEEIASIETDEESGHDGP